MRKRKFEFSTFVEEKDTPPPFIKPILTSSEVAFAKAMTTLIKAGYFEEVKTLLKLHRRASIDRFERSENELLGKPNYVDQRFWKFNPLTGEPL